MAEYVERGALLKVLLGEAVAKYPASFLNGLYAAADEVKKLPAADVVEVVPELRKAIKLLHEEYEKAKRQQFVRDPLSYALYQTWRAVDEWNR